MGGCPNFYSCLFFLKCTSCLTLRFLGLIWRPWHGWRWNISLTLSSPSSKCLQTPIILSWIKLHDDTVWSISEYIGIKTAMEGEMIKVMEEDEMLQVSASPTKHMWWSIHREGETAVNPGLWNATYMQCTSNAHANPTIYLVKLRQQGK